MDDYLQQALEIVKAQASVRTMSVEEIISMTRTLSNNLKNLEAAPQEQPEISTPAVPPQKSIKEKSVTCLECGKSFKIITQKHLSLHDLDADGYREKWGLKKGTPLVCKELQRERRKKMKEMKLWEKRKFSPKAAPADTQAVRQTLPNPSISEPIIKKRTRKPAN